MLRRAVAAICIPLLLCCAGCATTGVASEHAVLRAKNRVAPALVHIRPVKEVYTGGKREEFLVVGSGFIISPDGYVVTNEHVAGQSKFVRCVLYDKNEVEAAVVGVDASTDIAVLKLSTARTDLPYVRLGFSADLKAGQTVLALGSPHGLARSVSKGIVSVTDRYLGAAMDGGNAPYNTWIQTDAAINHGNSGGPLVNLKGEVVGINARKLEGAENVGFAIPIDTAKDVIDEIIQHGRVRRSWAGLALQEMTSKTDDPSQEGVVIADVDPLSPAAQSGILPGDILLAVAGQSVNARFAEDLPAVEKAVAELPVGESAVFTVMRAGQEIDIELITADRKDFTGQEVEFAEWGFTASEVTPAIVRLARLPSNEGVFVTGTQVGSVASDARLNRGDIILAVDGAPVANIAAFRLIYEELVQSAKDLVLLDVKRGALTRFTLIKQREIAETQGDGPEETMEMGHAE